MAEIRLGIAVDASGAIKSVQTFTGTLDKVPDSANRASGGLGFLKKQFDSFVSGLSVGAGIAVATKAIDTFTSVAKSATTALLAYSDRIVTLSQRTGQSLASLQAFNAVAKTSGTDLETVAKAATLVEAAIGKGDTSFKKLGLSVQQLKGMSPDEAFAKVATAVGSIEDPMQRAAAGVEIFGKRAAEMMPIFTSNIGEAMEQAKALGLVLSDDTLQAAEALGDAIDTAGMAFDAFTMRMVGAIAESPAVMRAVTEIGRLFGEMSKWLDDNKADLISWVNEGVEVAADAIVFLTGSLRAFLLMAQAGSGPAGWLDIGGTFKRADDIMASISSHAKNFRASIKQATMDMGGLGVLLPGGKMLPQGGSKGGGSFDATAGTVKEIKVAELKVPNLPGLWMDLFGSGAQGKFGTLQGGSKNYDIWGDRSKFLPPELAGNVHVGGADPMKQATFNLSQSLQNLANVAALSSSKLGKFVASIAGSGSGLASALQSLKTSTFGGGITGILGKAGVLGQVAASGIGIISGIFGLFKKKPREAAPAPEPAKAATAAAWSSFVGDQLGKGASGVMAGVSGIGVTGPEGMAAQASIASQVFWTTFKEKGIVAAAEAFRPVRDKMLETFKAAGASDDTINALLGPMSTQIDLAGNQMFKGAAEGSKGFADALASMANSQIPMTIDQFRAFENQALSGYEQMKQAAVDQGLSMDDAIKTALQSSGTYLTTLKDAASKYGFSLGGSQALFDQAQASGVGFATSSEDRLIMSLDKLTETLGGTPPKFEQAIAGAGARIGAGMESGGFTGGGKWDVSSMADAVQSGLAPLADAMKMAFAAPITVDFPPIMMDGNAIASGVAATIERGGSGGNRILTALDGR